MSNSSHRSMIKILAFVYMNYMTQVKKGVELECQSHSYYLIFFLIDTLYGLSRLLTMDLIHYLEISPS